MASVRARLARIERVIQNLSQAVSKSELALAEAASRVQQAEETVRSALSDWQRQGDKVRATTNVVALVWLQEHEFLQTLARRVQQAEAEVNRMRERYQVVQGELVEARRALKKVELWRDSLRQAEDKHQRFIESKQLDEIALRRLRGSAR